MISYDPGREQILEIIAGELFYHPALKPVDLFKALYQAAFGPFHIIQDKGKLIQAISGELWQMEHEYQPLLQNIGKKYSRISLSFFTKERDLDARAAAIEHLADWILSSSEPVEDAAEISKILWEKYLPFLKEMLSASASDWAIAQAYIDSGRLPSHSPEYHAAYHPHYRIVEYDLEPYRTLFFGEKK